MIKPKIFYGYWIIIVTFLCLSIFGGSVFFSFSLFITPLQSNFGWSRGDITMAFTISILIMAISSPFIGKLLDRYGPRLMIPSGALIFGTGFALLSTTDNVIFFYVFYAVVGVGMALIGPVPTSAVVSNWFKKRRGLALGMMSTGIGAGGLALAPLIGGYLIPTFGWRTSYLVLAILAWVLLIPLSLLVIRARPSVMGLYPDGAPEYKENSIKPANPATDKQFSLKDAVRTPAFWLIAFSFFAGCLSIGGTTQSQAPYLEDNNFSAAVTSGALGIVGLGSLVGKFGFGWLCDWMKPKYAWSIGLGFQLASLFILISVTSSSPVSLIWVYAIANGLSNGSWLPCMSMITSTSFGLAAYGVIFGLVSFAQAAGVAIGPLITSRMYDVFRNYDLAFIVLLVLGVIAMLAVLVMRYPKST
jgi:MFS family permease